MKFKRLKTHLAAAVLTAFLGLFAMTARADWSNNGANLPVALTSLSSGNILIYNGSTAFVNALMSGDCTMTSAGVLTCTKTGGVSFGTLATLNAAPAGTLTGTTLNSTVVTSSLTSVGPLAGGSTAAGFTVNLGASTISGNLPCANHPALTGNVTTSAGSCATTIGANQVANSMLATTAAHTYLGNNTGSTASPAAITSTQLTADLNLFSSTLQGMCPASGGGTTNFLRADGTYAAPAGSGTVTTTGSPASGNLAKFSGATSVTNGDLSGVITTSGSLVTTMSANAVANSNMATMAANTVKANATAGSATPTDISLSASNVLGRGGSGNIVALTFGNALSTTAGAINFGAGANPGGRLTLTTGTPVLTADATAQTTVYYTPYLHDKVPIYDGTNMVLTTFTEQSQLTTDTTKSPAAVAASSNYDVFEWNDSGTLRATRGPAWTSDTARGTGVGTTELQQINGIWTNKNAITNGPAANRGTYLGTIRSNGSSQIDVKLGLTPVATGPAAVLGVWNMYNRVNVIAMAQDSTDSWAYTSATIRAANGSNNNRVSMVRGMNEDGVTASVLYARTQSSGALSSGAGVGLDSTTTFSGNPSFGTIGTAVGTSTFFWTGIPGLGFHFLSNNESGNTNHTFYGDNGTPATFQTGLNIQTMW